MPYQDIFRDGKVIERGERDCGPRYKMLRRVVSDHEPFTMLDIGASAGYYSARVAHDFNARVTAVDNDRDLADLSDHPAIEVWNKRLNVHQLNRMKRHDFVLAFSILHHFADWKNAFDAMRACRQSLVIEIPDRRENWFAIAKARHEIAELHDYVAERGELIGTTDRMGRNRVTYQRPVFKVPGTLRTYRGDVFTGSGNCTDGVNRFMPGIQAELGYQPFPGSLNLRVKKLPDLGPPVLDWRPNLGWRPSSNATPRPRDYQFWRAWIGNEPCHVMTPGNRAHSNTLEVVAPVKLRERFRLTDGSSLTVDVERRDASAYTEVRD